MPIAVASIRRGHVEAFIAAELERIAPSSAATRYRSLQQLFRWLGDEGEIDGRRDIAIIRLFLDTGMRLEGRGRLL